MLAARFWCFSGSAEWTGVNWKTCRCWCCCCCCYYWGDEVIRNGNHDYAGILTIQECHYSSPLLLARLALSHYLPGCPFLMWIEWRTHWLGAKPWFDRIYWLSEAAKTAWPASPKRRYDDYGGKGTHSLHAGPGNFRVRGLTTTTTDDDDVVGMCLQSECGAFFGIRSWTWPVREFVRP